MVELRRMVTKVFLVLLCLISFSSQSPVRTAQEEVPLSRLRRGILDDPKTTATDRIILINEAVDVAPRLFEGDIEMTPDDLAMLTDSSSDDVTIGKRNAQRMRQGVWRTRKVPYEVDDVLVQDGFLEAIQEAIKAFQNETCIRWTKHKTEKTWVRFVKGKGCSSRVGKQMWQDGVQDITLGSGCNNKGTIMHEMMHAVGFWHEQSRPDRNQYVEVMWENIEAGEENNFEKFKHDAIDMLGAQYDYDSIMHYGRISFSKNGKNTIQAVGNPNRELGQREKFSQIDILKLNALYDCKSPSGGWSGWSSFTPCDALCNKYRQRYCTAENPADCPGADINYGIQTHFGKCTFKECHAPLDGHWGRWGSWSSCSVTCGRGSHTRTRQCDDPKPKDGGKYCVGSKNDRQACDVRSCSLGKYDCDFGADAFCHWTQDETDTNFDWIRNQGPTPSTTTGPDGDHTSGSGYYIFMEASGAEPGSTTRLLSTQLPPDHKRCVQFWFHMYGQGIGSLSVLLKDNEAGNMRKVWEMEGNQGNKWKEGRVEMSSDRAFQIVFEAVRGVNFFSDIGLDDIKISEGSCLQRSETTTLPPTTTEATTLPPTTTEATTLPPTTTEATTLPPTTTEATTLPPTTTEATTIPPTTTEATTIPPTTTEATTIPPTTTEATTIPPTTTEATTIPPTRPPIDEFCDFGALTYTECDWVNDPDNSHTPNGYVFDWWWTKGATPTKRTGPSGDHTTGSGYYLYLETSSPFKKGNVARLLSRRYPAAQVCLRFWYHMYGNTVDTLRVFLNHYTSEEKGVWEMSGNQGNEWHQAIVPISSSTPFEVMIEGTRGDSYTGDIAIDDIWVNEGVCPSNESKNVR